MVAMRLAGLLMLAGMVVGCQQKAVQPSTAAPPPNPQAVAAIRASYQQADPTLLTGLVIATLPNQPMVAVGDTAIQSFKVGDRVTFVSPDQNVLTIGAVKNITGDALYVEYVPQAGQRSPMVGDLVLRFTH